MPRHFSCSSFISTAAHDSQFLGAGFAVQSKSLVHRTTKEPLSLQGYICLLPSQYKIPVNVPLYLQYLQYLHSVHSFLPYCIQELPAPRAIKILKYSSSASGNFISGISPNLFGTFLPFSNLWHRAQE